MRHFKAGDRKRYALGDNYHFPGLSVHTIEWIRDHDVAAVFTDNYAYEVFPPLSPDWSDTLAVHMLHIRDMGLIQGQNWDFEALAADCAADGSTSSCWSPPRSRSPVRPARRSSPVAVK